jgi:hypothetical protein
MSNPESRSPATAARVSVADPAKGHHHLFTPTAAQDSEQIRKGAATHPSSIHSGKPFRQLPAERQLINLLNELSINKKLSFENMRAITYYVRQMKYELSDWIVEAYIQSVQRGEQYDDSG